MKTIKTVMHSYCFDTREPAGPPKRNRQGGRLDRGRMVVWILAGAVAGFALWLLVDGHVISASMVACVAIGLMQSTVNHE